MVFRRGYNPPANSASMPSHSVMVSGCCRSSTSKTFVKQKSRQIVSMVVGVRDCVERSRRRSHGRSWSNEEPGTEVRSFNARGEVKSEGHMFSGNRLSLLATAE